MYADDEEDYNYEKLDESSSKAASRNGRILIF